MEPRADDPGEASTTHVDKAGKAHWDRSWAEAPLPSAVDPRDRSLGNYVYRRLSAYYRGILEHEGEGKSERRLVEVGCAHSRWLPYFHKELGYAVTGVDYSEIGVARTRRLLSQEGVPGQVHHADLFAPPPSLVGSFDVGFSNGLAEHFVDTAHCIAALARLLKPGGLLVTAVPNLAGAVGAVQKHFNRPVYDIHVPLDVAALRRAHEDAGLKVVDARYLVFSNFGVVNLLGLARTPSWMAKRVALALLVRLSMASWLVEEHAASLPGNRYTSPYVLCVARKP